MNEMACLLRGSTAVVQLPVKELVVGSNPTRGANKRFKNRPRVFRHFNFK